MPDAQLTGGLFVFLTCREAADPHSGPGRETVHEVDHDAVPPLDRPIVRLVRDERARLGRGGPGRAGAA